MDDAAQEERELEKDRAGGEDRSPTAHRMMMRRTRRIMSTEKESRVKEARKEWAKKQEKASPRARVGVRFNTWAKSDVTTAVTMDTTSQTAHDRS